MWTCSIAMGMAISLASAPQDSADKNPVEVGLLTADQLHVALVDTERAHAGLVSLHNYGTSRDGRPLEVLRLTAAKQPADVPAILLVANLEGPRVFESGVALQHAQALASGYADDGRVKALLDSCVVWILPRANPDAAEGYFENPGFETWAAADGVDNDRDARSGEDGPEDLNGDGLVTQMRALDPDGEWIADPTDERVLIKADRSKGQRGRWKLYTESLDQDGDGEYGEDPPFDTRMDLNFPAGWREHAPDTGLYPTHEPEVRALVELVMGIANLALVVTYDGQDNLVEKPKTVPDDAPSVMRVPKPGVLESDGNLLAEIGERYREATSNESKGSGEDQGSFALWCYDHRGLITLNAVLWTLPSAAPPAEEEVTEPVAEAPEDDAAAGDAELDQVDAAPDSESGQPDSESKPDAKPSADAEHLLWIDATGEDWRFDPWSAFEHPTLGKVEIGGMTSYARYLPPAAERGEIAERQFDWFLGLGELPARMSIAECTKERLGKGVFRVQAVIQNEGLLPLFSKSGLRTRTTRPARVRLLLPEGASLLAGSKQELLRDLPGAGGRSEYTWLVQAHDDSELNISVDSDHAGNLNQQAELLP